MADKKISSLTQLSEAPNASDILPVVDISDTTHGLTGTTKKITVDDLISNVAVSDMAAAAVVNDAEGIAGNNLDTAFPTAKAVKTYVDAQTHTGEANQNAFSNVAVSGQTTCAADSSEDTLTLVGGTNVTLTTSSDSVTITATDTDTTYSDFNGDSGSGGSAGLVPAPSSGDAAAGKYLDSDGSWTVPDSGSGTVTSVTAGAGMTQSGTSTVNPTLNVIGGDGITANADEIEVAVDDATIELSATSGSGTVQAKTAAVTDGAATLATGDQIYDFVIAQGYTTNTGDMTGVDLTAGTGISIDSETNTTSGDYSATVTCDLEGTEVKSTGETGGSKFLREDGDGTCSWQAPSGSGTVTSVAVDGGTGLTDSGGPITSSGTITLDLDNTAVTAGSYTNADLTVDAQGRITSASNGTDTNTMGSGFTVSATTDTNATTITQGDDLMFTAGTGITCETTADGTVTITNTVSGASTATSSATGVIKLEDDTDQSVAANAVSTTAGRTYGLQLNSSDQGVVNVPWTDTNTNQLTTFTVSATTDSNATTISQGDDLMFTAGTGITCETTADGTVTISNTVTDTNTTYTAGDGLDLSGTEFSTDIKSNGGLKIDTTELAVDNGISQYQVPTFGAGVVDNDFLRIDGTTVEGRAASEVLSDIGAAASSHSHALGTDTTGDYVSNITGGTGISSTGATTGETISHTLSLDLGGLTDDTGTSTDGWTAGDFLAMVESGGTEKKIKPPAEICIACSDETTALTTGDAKVTFMIPRNMTITEVKASLSSPDTGSDDLEIDVRYHATAGSTGTTIFASDLAVTATEYYATKSGSTAFVGSAASKAVAENGFIFIDINDSSSMASWDCKGLKVWLIGYWG